VSGENLPGAAADREALGPETALVPAPMIEEVIEAFREWLKREIPWASKHTVRAYVADTRQHLKWLAAVELVPADVEREHLKAFVAYLVDLDYAPSTVNRKLAGVRQFYKLGQIRGLLPHNPAEGLRGPPDRTDAVSKRKYLSVEAARRLLAAPDPNTPKGLRDRAMLMLMCIHGLRVVEVHRLDLASLDFEAEEAGTMEVFGKGNKTRIVLLTEETREWLRMWLKARELMRINESAVFVTMNWANGRSEPGQRISTRSIRAMTNRYLKRLGLKKPRVSCHSLRHTAGTLGLALGADLYQIKGMLGHRSVKTTEGYVELVERARKNPAKYLVGLME
jgi:integrase/recombinase XerD